VKLISIVAPYNTFCKGCGSRLFKDENSYREFGAGPEADIYCTQCATGLVYEDPTRSVSIFYADVKGTVPQNP